MAKIDGFTGSIKMLNRRVRGPVVRVRRISDDAELDIGFDANGNVDSIALSAFIGGAVVKHNPHYTNGRRLHG